VVVSFRSRHVNSLQVFDVQSKRAFVFARSPRPRRHMFYSLIKVFKLISKTVFRRTANRKRRERKRHAAVGAMPKIVRRRRRQTYENKVYGNASNTFLCHAKGRKVRDKRLNMTETRSIRTRKLSLLPNLKRRSFIHIFFGLPNGPFIGPTVNAFGVIRRTVYGNIRYI